MSFIDEHKDRTDGGRRWGVESVCRVLRAQELQIAPATYYAAKSRPPSPRAVRDEQLKPVIAAVHEENYGVYGARKMQAALRRGQDVVIGRDQTARLMREPYEVEFVTAACDNVARVFTCGVHGFHNWHSGNVRRGSGRLAALCDEGRLGPSEVGWLAEEVRVLVSEDEADGERIEVLAGLLRSDLLELDVDDVTALRVGEAPPGSRGWDAATIGGLLVTLGHPGPGLAGVVGVVRAWLARGQGPRRTVRVEIGGDVLELSQASLADQDRLVAMFVRTHTPGSSPAEGQPADEAAGKAAGG